MQQLGNIHLLWTVVEYFIKTQFILFKKQKINVLIQEIHLHSVRKNEGMDQTQNTT